MIKIDIIAFKSGLFWYARCEIPPEEFDTYYYDNTPFRTVRYTTMLHSVGLTCNRATKKIAAKLQQYFEEKEVKEDD